MVKGRKPLANEVREAKGTFKRNPNRRPKTIVKADPRLPEPPDFLLKDEVATRVWHETVDVLKDMNILSKTDTHLLVNYCTTYAEWVKAYTFVAENGHCDNHQARASAESMTYHKLADRHLKLLAELGLTPSARARLSVAKTEDEIKEENSMNNILRLMK